jgi:mannitol/fructose-specific phosphotransferase system IIA component (Ntr-type)
MLKKGISWGNDHTISLVILFTLDSKHPEEATSCEHLLPGLFRLRWRSQLNDSTNYDQLIELFKVQLNKQH